MTITASPEAERGARTLGDLPIERLEAEICQLSTHLSAALCRWLLLVGEFDRREAWAQTGMRSCAHWLSWQCGLSLSTARHHVNVARRLAALPAVADAFGRGELSFSKVRAIARVATPQTEQELVELARHSTASQLERIVRGYVTAVRDNGSSPCGEPAPHHFLRYRYDDNGDLVGSFRLTPDEAAFFLAAIDREAEAAAKRGPAGPHPGADPLIETTPGERDRADALVACARRALAPQSTETDAPQSTETDAPQSTETDAPLPPVPPAHAHVIVHVTAEQLANADGLLASLAKHRFDLTSTVPVDAARRLTCDGDVSVMVSDANGSPVGVSNRTRLPSRRLRTALMARDRGHCQFPGCANRRYLHAHHIIHWANNGPTSLANLVLLCSFHHRAVHEGGFGVSGPGGAPTFTAPGGEQLTPSPAVPPLSADAPTLETLNAHAGADVTDPRNDDIGAPGRGERYDLRLTIDALFGLLHRPEPGRA